MGRFFDETQYGIDAGRFGEEDEPDDRVTCNRCGAVGLHWQEIVKADGSPGSKLFTERNRPHVCQIDAGAFGEVPE